MEALGKAIYQYAAIRRLAGLPGVDDADWRGMEYLTAHIRNDVFQVVRADIASAFCRDIPAWRDPALMSPEEIMIFAEWVEDAAILVEACTLPLINDQSILNVTDSGIKFDILTRMIASAVADGNKEYEGIMTHNIRYLLFEQLKGLPDWQYLACRFCMSFVSENQELTDSGKIYVASVITTLENS